ncbi:MAG: DNA methyltransferase [Candidatus Micrarchaeaceae archaeon]
MNKILCGDSLDLIKNIPDESVDLIITSPPYFQQRKYTKNEKEIGSEKKLSDYIGKLSLLFHECVRVTKKTGSIVFNLGDKYLDGSLLLVPFRFAINVLDKEPVKLVNNITWAKLNPTPRQFKGRLVNSTEPFFHFVKSDNYYYNLNGYMTFSKIAKKKTQTGTGIGRKYFDLIEKSDLSDSQKQMAIEELNQVIEEVKSGKISGFRMKINGIHSLPFGGLEGGRKTQMLTKGFTIIRLNGEFLKRDVIEGPVETIKGSRHPAIYPEYIIQQLLILLTKEGDIVLDPFIGSGTTAVACKKLRRNYIGFDINCKYCDDATARLKNIGNQDVLMEWII